jgi:hypothetical protein
MTKTRVAEASSFLDGSVWVLRTRVSRPDSRRASVLTHEAEIHATRESRPQWNAHFWSLFPAAPQDFHQMVVEEQINVGVMFRFRPTAKLKSSYGDQPVLKIARLADMWRGSLDPLPPALAVAIDDYERDKARLDEQRRRAWLELLFLRLPVPPIGYEWQLTSGDPRFYGGVLNFRLCVRTGFAQASNNNYS